MTDHSTTIILPDAPRPAPPPAHGPGRLDRLFARDRLWLLLIVLIIMALFLGGCHARESGCCHTSCGGGATDGVLAVYLVSYVLVWIIMAAAGG